MIAQHRSCFDVTLWFSSGTSDTLRPCGDGITKDGSEGELPGALCATLSVDFVPSFPLVSLLIALLASLRVLHHKADGV